MSIRIIIADDHALWRAGLAQLLEAEGLEVAAEAATGDETLEAVRVNPGTVLLLDIAMPGRLDGLATSARLKERGDDVKVIIVSARDDRDALFSAITAGAHGYIAKDNDVAQLVGAIHLVDGGGSAFGGSVTEGLAAGVAGLDYSPGEYERRRLDLSERELQVLRLLATPMTAAQIAARLFLSAKTVQNHASSIYEKLGARGRPITRTHSRAARSGYCRLLAHGLDLDLDLDLLADEQAAGLESLVPGKPERLAVDLGGGREADTLAAPQVGDDTHEFRVEGHLTRDPVDGEIALQRPLWSRDVTEPSRLEVDGRKLVDLQEVGRLQVVVARLLASRYRGRLDARRGLGLHGIVADLECGREALEAPLHLGDHQMADDELHAGVHRVRLPRAGRGELRPVYVSDCQCRGHRCLLGGHGW